MPSNHVLLGKVTLTATTSFITFSNIPQSGYTDLKLLASVRALRTGYPADDLVIQFNGVTTGYSGRRMFGNNASLTSDGQSDIRGFASDADITAGSFGSNEFYIPNYLSTTNTKSVSIEMSVATNGASAPHGIFAGLWNPATQAAINSIKVFCNNSSMVAGSDFALYGIAAVGTTPATSPFATGGDSVTTDGTYWIHTFLSSGTFAPAKALTCDYLVVAGGGGGGAQVGGGGGAGGYRTSIGGSALSVTAQNYLVQVGAGGVAGIGGTADSNSKGTNGTNSVFSSISSTGGGAGGSYQANSNGNSGGSGGGGTYGHTGGGSGAAGSGNAGSYSPVEGFAGGVISGSNAGAAGGGGGASAVGGNSSSGVGGVGGAGTANSISGSSVTYAGGGGGAGAAEVTSAGGAGGGGNGGGGSNTSSTAGTANTGGGGGGNRDSNTGTGSAGGSGIVIIRYPIA
jgi:hypothetical protein